MLTTNYVMQSVPLNNDVSLSKKMVCDFVSWNVSMRMWWEICPPADEGVPADGV